MIYLIDTNILFCYMLHDGEVQAARADAVFDTAEIILITDVVLMETVWALVGRRYRPSKADIVSVLERLFSEPNIRFEDDQIVWRALQAYRNAAPVDEAPLAKGVGFPNALIVFKTLRLASDDGESLNAVYTFDAAMQSLPHAAPLS